MRVTELAAPTRSNTCKEVSAMTIYEAFVYEWTNTENGKKYIGYHKGTTDDGYVCSSKSMLEDYNRNPKLFRRRIVATGRSDEMYSLENSLLERVSAATNPEYYNKTNGFTKIHFDDEMKERKRLKLSGSKWYTDGTNDKQVLKDEKIPKGYYEGRSNFHQSDSVWYNNGIRETKVHKGSKLPVGFVKGRLFKVTFSSDVKKKISEKSKLRKPYTDGVKNIYLFPEDIIPDGFYFGRSETSKKKSGDINRGSKWYTNGETNVRIIESNTIPEGFYPGRTYNRKAK